MQTRVLDLGKRNPTFAAETKSSNDAPASWLRVVLFRYQHFCLALETTAFVPLATISKVSARATRPSGSLLPCLQPTRCRELACPPALATRQWSCRSIS